MKAGCRSEHTVRVEMICETFQEAWPLREEERLRAEAGMEGIWKEVCVCVREGERGMQLNAFRKSSKG